MRPRDTLEVTSSLRPPPGTPRGSRCPSPPLRCFGRVASLQPGPAPHLLRSPSQAVRSAHFLPAGDSEGSEPRSLGGRCAEGRPPGCCLRAPVHPPPLAGHGGETRCRARGATAGWEGKGRAQPSTAPRPPREPPSPAPSPAWPPPLSPPRAPPAPSYLGAPARRRRGPPPPRRPPACPALGPGSAHPGLRGRRVLRAPAGVQRPEAAREPTGEKVCHRLGGAGEGNAKTRQEVRLKKCKRLEKRDKEEGEGRGSGPRLWREGDEEAGPPRDPRSGDWVDLRA